jgi:hypothetical protein
VNGYLTISLGISMTVSTLAIPLRAADKPRAEQIFKTFRRSDIPSFGRFQLE